MRVCKSVCIYNLKIVSLDSWWGSSFERGCQADDAKRPEIVDLIQKEHLLLSLCLCSVPEPQHSQSVLFICSFIYLSGLLIRMNVFLGLRVQINTEFGLESLPGQQSRSSCGGSRVPFWRSLMHNVGEFHRNTCVSSCVSLRFSQWPEAVCGSCKYTHCNNWMVVIYFHSDFFHLLRCVSDRRLLVVTCLFLAPPDDYIWWN